MNTDRSKIYTLQLEIGKVRDLSRRHLPIRGDQEEIHGQSKSNRKKCKSGAFSIFNASNNARQHSQSLPLLKSGLTFSRPKPTQILASSHVPSTSLQGLPRLAYFSESCSESEASLVQNTGEHTIQNTQITAIRHDILSGRLRSKTNSRANMKAVPLGFSKQQEQQQQQQHRENFRWKETCMKVRKRRLLRLRHKSEITSLAKKVISEALLGYNEFDVEKLLRLGIEICAGENGEAEPSGDVMNYERKQPFVNPSFNGL